MKIRRLCGVEVQFILRDFVRVFFATRIKVREVLLIQREFKFEPTSFGDVYGVISNLKEDVW